MGAADFHTGAVIKGTTEEIVTAVNVFKEYTKGNHPAYLMSCRISYDGEKGLGTRVNNMTDEEIAAFAANHDHTVMISASGPYGRFCFLRDVNLFQDLAEAVPHATISGGMDGFGTGGEQIASYELKDGLMVCKYHAGEPDEWDEDEEDWDEDEWDEDCDEPAWDYEEVYDPIAKKFIQK